MTALPPLLHRRLPPECLAHLSSEDFEHLGKVIAAAAEGGWARKTLAAFFSDGRLFASWCVANSRRWLPANPESVAEFVKAMAGEGRAPASIDRMMWSITSWHRYACHVDPVDDDLVEMARKAQKRVTGTRQHQAKGLGEAEVSEIEARLGAVGEDARRLDRLAARRDYALLLVAHDTLARPSELVAFLRADIVRGWEGEGTILKRRAKNDQTGRGKRKWLSPRAMAAIDAWLAAERVELQAHREGEEERVAALRAKRFGKGAPQGRKPAQGQKLEPVEPVRFVWPDTPYLFRGFAPVYEFAEIERPDGTVERGDLRRATGWSDSLSTNSVTLIFRKRLEQCGIDPTGYSGHSTRVGKLQDLLAKGVDLFPAMGAGDWKSPAMPVRYGEHILESRGAVAQTAASSKPRSE